MKNFEWLDATTLDQATSQSPTGTIKAGGVDLLDLMKEHVAEPARLINIRNIPNLNFIEEDEKQLRVGPLVTLAQIADDSRIQSRYGAFAQGCGHAATPQIRNMATVGGNLLQRPRCWYFRHEEFPCRKKGGEKCFAQDGENQYHAIFNNALCAIVHPSSAATALVAHGASIELTSKDSKRTILLEEFFSLPSVDLHKENKLKEGELITQIIVPRPPEGTRSLYIKQGEKESFDWPIADVALVLERELEGNKCERASIILGAAAPVPHRAREAEKMLEGKTIDEPLARQAAQAALAGATPLRDNGYKVKIFQAILRRAILQAAT